MIASSQAGKPWWRSRMIRLNVLAAGLVALEASTGVLQPYLPVDFYAAMSVILPILNAMLRVVTSQPLNGGGNAS